MDLENDSTYTSLGVPIVSIAFDPVAVQDAAAGQYGVESTPMLSDADHAVSESYDVLQWAVATGEPGHTFVLVDGGEIAWIRDYGAPENGGSMYVTPAEIAAQVAAALGR
ncbi:MAG: peroxiredoxin family protein [Actinobacteria bacterium]|nr:peroxiredoxin family protein [Actinomycetota bacterium]